MIKPYYQDDRLTVHVGHCLDVLAKFPDESVQCVVTSPPYWGLRDYGVKGQIGLEKTLLAFLAVMVAVFEEVRRVLRGDGTCWVNLGDAYCSGTAVGRKMPTTIHGPKVPSGWTTRLQATRTPAGDGLKPKDLCGIPWRVAFALQEAGWYLRSDIIWHKPNPMPESVTDRPTKAHEYIFLLSKSPRYFYDSDAIREPVTGNAHARGEGVNPKSKTPGRNSRIHVDRDPAHARPKPSRQNESFSAAVRGLVDDRNKRSIWTVATHPFKGAHFATFPPDLIKPCIMAGSRLGDVVLDPFFGAGTTGLVALELGRKCIGIELNPQYAEMAKQRCLNVTPGLELLFTARITQGKDE